jgi:acyl dehydratase
MVPVEGLDIDRNTTWPLFGERVAVRADILMSGRGGAGVKYFEDFNRGEVIEFEATYLVTEEEIREFGERWDPRQVHVDPVAAAESPFGGLVASSAHLFAIAISLSSVKDIPIAAISSLGFRSIDNHAPVRPGDRLIHRSTTLESRMSGSRPGVGIVSNQCDLLNQRGEVVFSFENAALIRCRPAPD